MKPVALRGPEEDGSVQTSVKALPYILRNESTTDVVRDILTVLLLTLVFPSVLWTSSRVKDTSGNTKAYNSTSRRTSSQVFEEDGCESRRTGRL